MILVVSPDGLVAASNQRADRVCDDPSGGLQRLSEKAVAQITK